MKDRARKVKMILFDVDGVLTDGGIIYGTNDLEIKKFNVQDGMGITIARRAGFLVGILTGRSSEVVARRAEELSFDEVSQGHFNKLEVYEEIRVKYGLEDEEIAYVGDDVLDIPILERVGLAIGVSNAVDEVKGIAHYVTRKAGGSGAAREAIDMILDLTGKKEEAIRSLITPGGERE